MSRNPPLPQGKRIHVYRSGDRFFQGAPVTMNPRIYRSMEKFLEEVSHKVPVFGAVRSIHTPNTGTKIQDLNTFHQNSRYVAAGPKGFSYLPGGYENVGKLLFPGSNRFKRARKRKNRASKFLDENGQPLPQFRKRRVLKNGVLGIWVYKNGGCFTEATPLHITQMDLDNWDQALDRISHEVRLTEGKVKYFYDFDGNLVDPDDFRENGTYVAVAARDTFRPATYVEMSSGGSSSHMPTSRSNQSPHFANAEEHSSNTATFRTRPRTRSVDTYLPTNATPGGSLQESYPIIAGSTPSLPTETDLHSYGEVATLRSQSEQSFYSESKEDNYADTAELRDATPQSYASIGISSSQESYREESLPRQSYNDEESEDGYDSPIVFLDRGRESSGEQRDERQKNQLLSPKDSGRASMYSDDDSQSEEIFWAKTKSRSASRAIEVDYDTDGSGRYRAKSRNQFTSGAQDVFESSETRIEVPVDLLEAKEVEEAY